MSAGPQAAWLGPPHLTPPAGPLGRSWLQQQCPGPGTLSLAHPTSRAQLLRLQGSDAQPSLGFPARTSALQEPHLSPENTTRDWDVCCWLLLARRPQNSSHGDCPNWGVCEQTHEPVPSHRPEDGGDACSPGSACWRGLVGPTGPRAEGPTGVEQQVRVSEPAPPTSPPPWVFSASPAWRNSQGRVVRALGFLARVERMCRGDHRSVHPSGEAD